MRQKALSIWAKKKLQVELRETTRLKIVHSEPAREKESFIKEVKTAPSENYDDLEIDDIGDLEVAAPVEVLDGERREALTSLAAQLLELREMLKSNRVETASTQQRKY